MGVELSRWENSPYYAEIAVSFQPSAVSKETGIAGGKAKS